MAVVVAFGVVLHPVPPLGVSGAGDGAGNLIEHPQLMVVAVVKVGSCSGGTTK